MTSSAPHVRDPQHTSSAGYLAGICLTASLGGLLFGFDTAVISGTFGFVEEQYGLSKLEVGWFGSSALVGCIVGAAMAGAVGDRFGRKPALLTAGLLLFISALFSCVPWNFDVLILARIIGGGGVGIASVVAPMYISEFAPPRLRGRLVGTYQMSIVIGILLAYCCNWALLKFAAAYPEAFGGEGALHWILVAEAWRGMFGAEMAPAAMFFLLVLMVPESPRWLAKEGRDAEALRILTAVTSYGVAVRELDEIRTTLAQEQSGWKELLGPRLRRPLVIGVGLALFGQLTGINIVVYYGPTILQQAGFERVGAFQFQVGLGLVNLIFTLFAIALIDRAGRRPLLLGGMAVVTLTLTVTGLLFILGGRQAVSSQVSADGAVTVLTPEAGRWVVAALAVYMACNAISICAVIWVLTAEIFPTGVRGRAVSVASFVNWSSNAGAALLFPWYVDNFGMHSGFLTFAAACLVGTLFFWKYVPETKGKSLEDIAQFWLPRLPATFRQLTKENPRE